MAFSGDEAKPEGKIDDEKENPIAGIQKRQGTLMTVSIAGRLIDKFLRINKCHLLWISVLSSVLLTLTIVCVMSLVFHGKVTDDYLVIWAVAASVVSFIVSCGLLIIRHELQKVTAALRSGEKRLKYILASSPAVIYTCTPTGDYTATFISENVREQLGYEPSDFLSDPAFWARNIHPEDAQRVFAELPGLFECGHLIHEYRFLRRDGTYLWLRDDLRLVRDQSDEPLEIVGSWLDITARRQAEETLREKNIMLQTLIHSIPDLVFFKDSAGRILLVNKAVEEALGLGQEELSGTTYDELLPPGVTDKCKRSDAEAICSGLPVRSEERYTDKNGTLRVLDFIKAPIHDDKGAYMGLALVGRDITEHKRAEERLQEGENRFRTLFEEGAEGIIFIDNNGNIAAVNKSFAHMHGYSCEEMLNMNVNDLGAQKSFVSDMEILRRLLAGEPVCFEVEHYHSAGHSFPLEVSTSLIPINGKYYYVCLPP